MQQYPSAENTDFLVVTLPFWSATCTVNICAAEQGDTAYVLIKHSYSSRTTMNSTSLYIAVRMCPYFSLAIESSYESTVSIKGTWMPQCHILRRFYTFSSVVCNILANYTSIDWGMKMNNSKKLCSATLVFVILSLLLSCSHETKSIQATPIIPSQFL